MDYTHFLPYLTNGLSTIFTLSNQWIIHNFYPKYEPICLFWPNTTGQIQIPIDLPPLNLKA